MSPAWWLGHVGNRSASGGIMDSLRFGELANLVEHVRYAGTTPGIVVMGVGPDQDPDMLIVLHVRSGQ